MHMGGVKGLSIFVIKGKYTEKVFSFFLLFSYNYMYLILLKHMAWTDNIVSAELNLLTCNGDLKHIVQIRALRNYE